MRTLTLIPALAALCGAQTLFTDAMSGKLDKQWTWVREKSEARKIDASGLHLRVLSGTLWAKDNSGSNMLVRPMPEGAVSTEVTVVTEPALLNEQAGLIWYGGDGDYIKLVKEMKEQPYIILGREEKEAAKTYGRIAMPSQTVMLRLTRSGDRVIAHARTANTEWQQVGECAALAGVTLQPGVFASVLPGETDRWATFRDFRISSR